MHISRVDLNLLVVLDAIRCGMTGDHQEAARAFVEKRAPKFNNR